MIAPRERATEPMKVTIKASLPLCQHTEVCQKTFDRTSWDSLGCMDSSYDSGIIKASQLQSGDPVPRKREKMKLKTFGLPLRVRAKRGNFAFTRKQVAKLYFLDSQNVY